MRVVSPKMLREFWAIHPEARSSLKAWLKTTTDADWESFDDVKVTFGKRADRYKQFVIFDVGGNKYRLITAIHYNRGLVYLRHVLTHAEYDLDKWKDD